MACYISSNDNRFYVGVEAAYGQVATISAQNRISAVKLTAKQKTEKIQRKDKTGTRTFLGDPASLRRTTAWGLKTYMTGWTDTTQPPMPDPLFQGLLGNPGTLWQGGTVASAPSTTRLAFTAPHGLAPGQAVSLGGEIRFVAAIADPQTILLNAPFTAVVQPNAAMTATYNYQPGTNLPSVSVFDYWSPATAVQRILTGSAVNDLSLNINSEIHEFDFTGLAADLIDSVSFESGEGGLTTFPVEPAVAPLTYSIIPGHLGQAWLGSTPAEFFSITKAQLTFNNNLVLRDREFGSSLARCITPGIRDVSIQFSLYANGDTNTEALYQAARQRSPISVMLQLGQQAGQLFGVYMKSVVAEVPEFDDADLRQQWHFVNCRAQGSLNDEIFFAFG